MTVRDSGPVRPGKPARSCTGHQPGCMGDIIASKKPLQAFVDDNPKHPLVADAKQVIAEL